MYATRTFSAFVLRQCQLHPLKRNIATIAFQGSCPVSIDTGYISTSEYRDIDVFYSANRPFVFNKRTTCTRSCWHVQNWKDMSQLSLATFFGIHSRGDMFTAGADKIRFDEGEALSMEELCRYREQGGRHPCLPRSNLDSSYMNKTFEDFALVGSGSVIGAISNLFQESRILSPRSRTLG